MATYNGERYVKEQIDSILVQLDSSDELIISDDNSKDKTRDIINSYADARIHLVLNQGRSGVVPNFENALNHASGDLIFLSDQDDVWLPCKIKEMSRFLFDGQYDVASCNCAQTDDNLTITKPEFYSDKDPVSVGVFGNWLHHLWLGSCMVFTRKVLDDVLPFPEGIAAHDFWISQWAQLHYKCGYNPKVMQYYRRHGGTASFAGLKSKNSLSVMIGYRFAQLYNMIRREIERKYSKK